MPSFTWTTLSSFYFPYPEQRSWTFMSHFFFLSYFSLSSFIGPITATLCFPLLLWARLLLWVRIFTQTPIRLCLMLYWTSSRFFDQTRFCLPLWDESYLAVRHLNNSDHDLPYQVPPINLICITNHSFVIFFFSVP